jgi:hypothetical protein
LGVWNIFKTPGRTIIRPLSWDELWWAGFLEAPLKFVTGAATQLLDILRDKAGLDFIAVVGTGNTDVVGSVPALTVG